MIVETADDLHEARRRLGWSIYELARALKMCPVDAASDDQRVKQAGKRIREMEGGAREISGPISVAVEALLTGFRPEHFDPN